MIQQVTCSAGSILRLINPQIQYIIDQVNSKTINDQSHVTKNFPPESPQGSEKTDEVVRTGEEYLPSFGIINEDADIKIFDDSFFSDEPGDSNHLTANIDTAKVTSGVDKDDDIKLFDEISGDKKARTNC